MVTWNHQKSSENNRHELLHKKVGGKGSDLDYCYLSTAIKPRKYSFFYEQEQGPRVQLPGHC